MRDKYGSKFFAKIGAKGGCTDRERHGSASRCSWSPTGYLLHRAVAPNVGAVRGDGLLYHHGDHGGHRGERRLVPAPPAHPVASSVSVFPRACYELKGQWIN